MRADTDVICHDRAGIRRFVAFGSDIPDGWTVVGESSPNALPANAGAAAARGNVDAAVERTRRLEADTRRQRATAAGAGELVTTPAETEQVVPVKPIEVERVAPEDPTVATPAVPETAEVPAPVEPTEPAPDEPASPAENATDAQASTAAPAEKKPADDDRKGRRGRRS